MTHTREDAWNLLVKYTKSESLLKHGLGVEQVMRAMAEKYNEDVEKWGITGLLHDFDYEAFPTAEEHPYKGNQILKEFGWADDICEAIMGHAEYTNVARDSLMAKSLFSVDELIGLVFAVTYVRPSRSIMEVSAKSVKKKFKQKSFAASVSREDILLGLEELNLEMDVHFQFVIDALKGKAETLGLAGVE